MNTDAIRKITVCAIMLTVFLTSMVCPAQVRFTQSGESQISISGTSTIHKWTMTSKGATCDAVFETNEQGEPQKLNDLSVAVPTESLKSGKNAMDKNAYSALKTNKHKQITFQLSSDGITGNRVRCAGKLTVAGTTREIELEAICIVLPNGTMQCKGSKEISMTDYNVDPPSFMFGTVTTGNVITVSFNVILISKEQVRTIN